MSLFGDLTRGFANLVGDVSGSEDVSGSRYNDDEVQSSIPIAIVDNGADTETPEAPHREISTGNSIGQATNSEIKELENSKNTQEGGDNSKYWEAKYYKWKYQYLNAIGK